MVAGVADAVLGQAGLVHATVCWRVGHVVPPLAEAVVTVRVWVMVPLPHVLEHDPTSFQADTTQLTALGQACVLQGTLWVRLGHALPPLRALTVTSRD